MTVTPKQREKEADAYKVQRFWPVVSGAVAVLLVGLGGFLIALRDFQVVPFDVDAEWMEELVEHRHPFWQAMALAFDHLGGGILGVFIVPLAVIAVLFLLKRRWAALYFAVASVVSALLVQIIKNLVGRPRPEEILVAADFGSFPSGHTANAATMAVALALILRRYWIWFAGAAYVVLMLLSRNYLGAHWLTDTMGGMVLGAGVAVIAWAPFAHRLHVERRRKQPDAVAT
ncbi:phosphatase PAP2 family protein [Planctomonas deserti]|jgi:membrane-associated phospholipid phosphatase|uniref:phosphatase PAP2 family protein n=1 Tax=Planctomonas deserti TaxID=2144185 RepID=UPI000D34921E|nr:phosphatase PAP2 family protein [Planctomonas deserti]